MHYIEVYFCQQSEFGDSVDSFNKHTIFAKGLYRLLNVLAISALENFESSYEHFAI